MVKGKFRFLLRMCCAIWVEILFIRKLFYKILSIWKLVKFRVTQPHVQYRVQNEQKGKRGHSNKVYLWKGTSLGRPPKISQYERTCVRNLQSDWEAAFEIAFNLLDSYKQYEGTKHVVFVGNNSCPSPKTSPKRTCCLNLSIKKTVEVLKVVFAEYLCVTSGIALVGQKVAFWLSF